MNLHSWCTTDMWNASNWNWEQIYRTYACFSFFNTFPLGIWELTTFEWVLNTIWTQLSAPECPWMSVKHPLNMIECTWIPWVSVNAPECDWVYVNAFERGLSALAIHKKHFWLLLWLLLLIIMLAIIDYHYCSTWTKQDIFGTVPYIMMSVGMNYNQSVLY